MLELIEQLGSSTLQTESAALTRELKRLAKSAVGSSDLAGKVIIKQAAQRQINSSVMAALTRAIIEQVRVNISYRPRGATHNQAIATSPWNAWRTSAK